MEYKDNKKRKLKPIGQSFYVIIHRRKAEENGFNENDDVDVTISK